MVGRELELSYSWTHQSLAEDFPRGIHIPRRWAFYVCEPSSMRAILQKNKRYWLWEAEVHQRGGRRCTQNCLKGSKGIRVKSSVFVFPSIHSIRFIRKKKPVNYDCKDKFILNSVERCSTNINHSVIPWVRIQSWFLINLFKFCPYLFNQSCLTHLLTIFSSRVLV